MRVLVGGGSGFIGTALTQMLKAKGHKVTLVSRKPGLDRITWDELASSGLPPCDAAVNLAGENILNPLRRWNEAFQKEVISSRLETTHMMATAIAKAPQPPQAWVLVTGVAYYQPSLTAEYDEDSPGGDFDFFSNLVTKWEAAARLPGDSTRQVVVRSGVVLGRGGGASQLDYLWKISQEMLTVVTKPQNTTSNPLESNGKGPLDSVADQGQSVSMSLPANQSQTRQHFVPQNIQNNILPARVQSYAGLSSGLSPTINYQTREQFVPQNIQNSILTAGVQSSVGLSSALSPTGNYHLYGLQPPAPGQNIPGLSYALPPPQGLNMSALLASIPSGFSAAPASIMRPSTLQSSLPRLQQNQQSTIPHSSQSMLQQTAVPQQQMLPQQHQQQQLTGSSTDQQNKKNPSQSIAELLTTIKNSQQQVPMGSIQQTPVSAPQQANMNVQSGINTLHPNVIPLGILQNQQQYQNQLQQQYQIQLLHQQRQQLQLMQMQQINQQLQQQLARQSQTHQMPQLHQIRVVDANMNASSSQGGSNMLQANIVSPLPNSGIVDNQHLKQEQEQKMFKHQPQQPYQQLQMQKPQMLQEKQQQKIQQLEEQAKQQLCHIYFIYLIFLTILMGALIFGIGH